MRKYLIPALLSLMTTGCVVTTNAYVHGHDVTSRHDVPWTPRLRQLPASSRRVAEAILATDSQRVRHGHVAVRDERSVWSQGLTEQMKASSVDPFPLEAPAALLVKGLPAEVARWLSIAEFHWQVGAKGHVVRHRSVDRGYAESDDNSLQNQAIRQVLRFQVGSQVICASQRKIYGELIDRPVPEATDLVTAYRLSQGLDPDDPFGVRSKALVGQVVMQVFELDGAQVRVEVHQGLARTNSVDAEAVDTILVCSMPRNIRAADLGNFLMVETHDHQAVLFRPAQKVAWAAH